MRLSPGRAKLDGRHALMLFLSFYSSLLPQARRASVPFSAGHWTHGGRTDMLRNFRRRCNASDRIYLRGPFETSTSPSTALRL